LFTSLLSRLRVSSSCPEGQAASFDVVKGPKELPATNVVTE